MPGKPPDFPSDLMPCPFCGESPRLSPAPLNGEARNGRQAALIECDNPNCGATVRVRAVSIVMAILGWNTRGPA